MSERVEFYIEGRAVLDEPYHLKAVGLGYVYLRNGVTIEDDPDCGRIITIEDMDGLHRAIALHIVEKDQSITGAELRFLRKQMGLTQDELGERLKVTSQTVANYEKGVTQIPGGAEGYIRVMYVLSILPEHEAIKLIQAIVSASKAGTKRRALSQPQRKRIVRGWHELAIAA